MGRGGGDGGSEVDCDGKEIDALGGFTEGLECHGKKPRLHPVENGEEGKATKTYLSLGKQFI